MKTNKKALKLIEMGLSPKTVLNLKESEIDTLFNKFNLSEQVKGAVVVKSDTDPTKIKAMTDKGINVKVETEMTETETDDVTDKNALGADALQSLTGQDAPHMANDMAPDGMDDDSDNDRNAMGESKKEKVNAWAICTAQLGKQFKTRERSEWNAKQKNKYERCVKDVKQSIKEGKDPYIFLIEKEIVSLVERNIEPRMTKRDLIKMLSEQPTTAPTKPDTKPGVKPGTKPRTRPAHPGKNPNPGENPSPKAVDKEKAKDDVIQVIMKLLKDGE